MASLMDVVGKSDRPVMPGFTFTEFGMYPDNGPVYDKEGELQESWLAAGAMLSAVERTVHKSFMLCLGDWLKVGMEWYEDALERATLATGYSRGYLYNVSWTVSHMPEEARKLPVRFSVMVSSMRIKDDAVRLDFLKKVANENLAGMELELELAKVLDIPEPEDPLRKLADRNHELEVENSQLEMDLAAKKEELAAVSESVADELPGVLTRIQNVRQDLHEKVWSRYDVTGELASLVEDLTKRLDDVIGDMETIVKGA